MPLKAKAAAKSDVGLVRRSNQDCFGIDEDQGLYVVCDGMGGVVGGEVASRVAVESFLASARAELAATGALNGQRNGNALLRASQAANRAVRLRASYETQLRGMGTTLVGARLDGAALSVVNIGDSRAYLVRGGKTRQLTEDHSYVAESVRRGLMSQQQAEQSHLQSVITRAIGADDDLEPDLYDEVLEDGDAVLLCTDGLTRHVTDEQIAAVLSRAERSAVEGCRLLIEMAKDGGGSDNITCLVLRLRDETALRVRA